MLPKVPAGRTKTKRQTVGFLGLNYGEGASDGEFRETKNLSARKFPALSPRRGREQLTGYTAPSALFSWNGLVAVDGTDLKIDGETVATVTPGEKQFAVVGTKLCVFPDKVYLDLTKRELVPLSASIRSKSNTTVTFTANTLTITPQGLTPSLSQDFSYYYISGEGDKSYTKKYTAAQWDSETKAWTLTGEVETSIIWETQFSAGDILMLRKTGVAGAYTINAKRTSKAGSGDDWEVVQDYGENDDNGYYAVVTKVESRENSIGIVYLTVTYNVLSAANQDDSFADAFKVGDRVTVTGAEGEVNNVEKRAITALTDTTLTFAAGTFTAGTQTAQVTIIRPVPDLDYVCESQNRLWGVSKADNTIYASALGDPTNFYAYDGTSLDSYAVAVGSEGEFTAICKYDRSVLCFKENTLHRVYGDYPAEYSATERPIFGVKAGAAGTLTGIGSVLYYLGRDGVYAFSGNTPAPLSAAFGEKRFSRGCAGAAGDILYMSLKDTEGVWGLFTYDTRKGLWLREDGTFALAFATVGGELHYVFAQEAENKDIGEAVFKADSENAAEKVAWEAELSPFTEGTLRRKSPSRVILRCELPEGAWISAEISCDNEPWKQIFTSAGRGEPTIVIPIAPSRCDAWRLRLSGQGECVIRAIEREFKIGRNEK